MPTSNVGESAPEWVETAKPAEQAPADITEDEELAARLASQLKPREAEPKVSQGSGAASAEENRDSTPGEAPSPNDLPASRQETWDLCLVGGSQAGYEHAVIEERLLDGKPVRYIRQHQVFELLRFKEKLVQELVLESWENLEGQLLHFQGQQKQGLSPIEFKGQVRGDTLFLETVTLGRREEARLDWRPDYGGFRAVEFSLEKQPMQPGEHRIINCLLPVLNVVAKVELWARNFEPVKLTTGIYELLRVDIRTTAPGGLDLTGSLWADRRGQVLKSTTDLLQLEVYRVSKEEALADTVPANFDFGEDVAIRLERPISAPHHRKQLTYRIRLESGDPARLFATGFNQAVRPVAPDMVEVTVYSVRPGHGGGNPAAPEDPATDDDREPNSFIQSDYPAIQALAKSVANDEKDPWTISVALEELVARFIRHSNYRVGFATAAEVADSQQGDCTEHAVLLAALARARRIPARVAVGLVYRDQMFYYHMWTEVFIKGRWYPLDATLGQGGIGVGHLKMATSSMKGPAALAALLPTLNALGRLKIEVVEPAE